MLFGQQLPFFPSNVTKNHFAGTLFFVATECMMLLVSVAVAERCFVRMIQLCVRSIFSGAR
jgi:hypothetical protein